MSKEPKSPKGEKASERFWKSEGKNPVAFYWCISQEDKEVHDKLVSLEAKIEVLTQLINSKDVPTSFCNNLAFLRIDCKSEYSELLKEHNL